MKKSIKVAPKKRRGRPATGKDPHIAARMPSALITEVEAWAAANDTTRSEAIRRLVELGLTVRANKPKQAPAERAARTKELASKAIDNVAGAPDNDQTASRKRRLIKGPEEFRDDRVDLPKAKAK
jgi:predicted fused transcriptional regulator/phosphomethylpyrimidine kinase